MMTMRFTSGISDAVSATTAADAACQQVLAQLAGNPCHLAYVFASTIYRAAWPDVLQRIQDQLAPEVLIGCSGSGIIGGEQEIEWVPALSIVGAHLPEVRLFSFAVTPEEMEGSSSGGFWVDKVGASPEAQPSFNLFVDPFTGQPEKLISELNDTYRGRPVIGGLVSGGNHPGEHLLFHGTTMAHDGAVGVAMTGNVAMDTVVSQGCRPIGKPYVVTKAEENVVWQLGGRQTLSVLHEVLSALSVEDRDLARQGGLVVGVVINEMRPSFASGDFLIRNIVGLEPELGALAVADDVQVGQTLQFHLRDAATSRQELRRLLTQSGQTVQGAPYAGCLLFNCTGRGKSFYGTAHHDVRTIKTVSGKLPIGGFFCNGEIGPIGPTNFLHGYTASLGLFRPVTSPLYSVSTPEGQWKAKDAAPPADPPVSAS